MIKLIKKKKMIENESEDKKIKRNHLPPGANWKDTGEVGVTTLSFNSGNIKERGLVFFMQIVWVRDEVVRCVGVCVSEQRPAWRRESNEVTLVRVVIIVTLGESQEISHHFFPQTFVLSTPSIFIHSFLSN